MVSRLRRPLLALALAVAASTTAVGVAVVAHHPRGANAEPVRATAVDLPPRPVVRTPKPTKGERAARIALRALGLDPLLELGVARGEGLAAALALPLIDDAARVLRELV